MKNKRSNRIADGQATAAWLLSAPSLIIIIIFMIIPFAMSIVYSFTNKMLVANPNNPLQFVGLSNYIRVFTNETAVQAFANTAFFALLFVPFTVVISTILAVFVNRSIKGIGIIRLIYFSPQIVSLTVVAVIWAFIFSPSADGLLNSILQSFGIESQLWLKDPKQAMYSIAVMSIWQAVGMQMIIILGGLQYIPEEIYEAAKVDGAKKWQSFLLITVPMLRNTLNFVIITNTIAALKLFTQVLMLTEGGPQNSTNTVVYFMYNVGFSRNQIGYSSAMAVVFFVIVLIISLIQNKVITKGE
ncbi:carbohydrate ABC transporter permease [Paenibacillus senegalensis]|uniref:carbohydrate ABC transporter permease n=1 Tax=Paenibacillus senegalensis TaxID=1465766 RepID=UPI00028905AB|nr:sugar ABC transporter permease [Paenibacillus senegalensis]